MRFRLLAGLGPAILALTLLWAPTPGLANPPAIEPRPAVTTRDPRFGIVQAIQAPGLALGAGATWERIIFPWADMEPRPGTLLGGYFSSRITTNIREQKGYTYSPFSQISWRHGDAYWAEQADVTTAVTGASLKEILGEIDRLQAEAPGADELKAVQAYIAGTFVLRNSTRGGIIAQLQYVDLHGLPATYVNDYVSKVMAVTPADV